MQRMHSPRIKPSTTDRATGSPLGVGSVLASVCVLAVGGLAFGVQDTGEQGPESRPEVEVDPWAPLDRSGSGEPTCGLGKAFHLGRRAELRSRLEPGVIVLHGLPETRSYVKFSQDKVFWYLTGIESPDASVLIDVESGREVLFLPRKSRMKEGWEGELWDAGDPWIPELTGFDEVRSSRELMGTLEEWVSALEGEARVYQSTRPFCTIAESADRAGGHSSRVRVDPLDGRPSRERQLKNQIEERIPGVEVTGFDRQLDRMRLVKTPEEAWAMRRSSRAGALAMAEAIRSTRPGLGEWDLGALMTWVQKAHGAEGPAYQPIVGSGSNSCVLHYSAANRRMKSGEVVLIDFGCELDHYTTDITRTWPVNGHFDEVQGRMYDLVLEAQLAGIAEVKPGSSLGAVDGACREVLLAGEFPSSFIKHSAVHWIGMEVHDAGTRGVELEVGMCFTVEPGLYDDGRGVGIRIEDVVMVTEEGCEVLSRDVPKERAAIEALVAEEGILDRVELGRR